MRNLGRVLAVVNPAARGGQGAKVAAFMRYAAANAPSAFESFEMESTREAGHAEELAAQAFRFDTLLAVGGDGVVHEAVNGLMRLPQENRPAFGVIPCGNGNDYARTLGMSLDAQEAFSQLLESEERPTDVGLCNGRYFAETLSFGLDAAIALGTRERRLRTGARGTRLYIEEGINQLLLHRGEYGYMLSLEGGEGRRSSMLTFAVQIGPTYGGGFKICPEADPCDGLLDMCIAHPPMGFVSAAALFLRAKSGGHVSRTDALTFARASRLSVEFDSEPPAQADGEPICGARFDVEAVPGALRSLFAVGSRGGRG